FWIFVGPALALAMFSLRGERKLAEYVTSRLNQFDEAREWPFVTLVVPPNAAPETIDSLAGLDYPTYEAVASPEASRPDSKILAFGPARGVVAPSWLRGLVAPLLGDGVRASTGFRCYVPEPPTFWSLVRSIWNGVIAGRLGPGANDFTWPGATASWKEDSAGRIGFAPGAMIADKRLATFGGFFRDARSEMAEARKLLPRLWWEALLSHIFYCGAMLAAAIASVRGSRGAEWALVAQFGLGMLKGANRVTFAKAELAAF